MSYRDTLVTCDTKKKGDVVGTRPASCPKKPMPMIDTPKKSYIADYTPYLFHYPRDEKKPELPYSGSYSLGTPGDATNTFQMVGNTAPGTKRLAACTTQIKVPSDPTTPDEWAKLGRLQLDNCANQYILRRATTAMQKEDTDLLSMDDLSKPDEKLKAEGECQPLKTFTPDNEYSASI